MYRRRGRIASFLPPAPQPHLVSVYTAQSTALRTPLSHAPLPALPRAWRASTFSGVALQPRLRPCPVFVPSPAPAGSPVRQPPVLPWLSSHRQPRRRSLAASPCSSVQDAPHPELTVSPSCTSCSFNPSSSHSTFTLLHLPQLLLCVHFCSRRPAHLAHLARNGQCTSTRIGHLTIFALPHGSH